MLPRRKLPSISGRRVLITGAARGIGAALAERLHEGGAKVALVGLEPALLAEVAARCDAPWWPCDVSDRQQVDEVVEAAVDALGGLDVVVANAGIAAQLPLVGGDPTIFEKTIAVNVLGAYYTVRAAGPHISHDKGYALVVSSLGGAVHLPLMGAYSASKARIAPGSRSEIGVVNSVITRLLGLMSGTNPPNLFTTMARQPRLFRGWLRFAGRLMPGGKLPRRETELVILRVAHLAACDYEFDHHVRLAQRAGVTAADVERVVAGPGADGWTPRERALLTAVNALHNERTIEDHVWNRLTDFLDEPQLVELCLLVGHYEMLATFINTLRIDADHRRRWVPHIRGSWRRSRLREPAEE